MKLGCSETLRWHFSPDNWNWRRQFLDDFQCWAQRDETGHVVWFLLFNVSAPMWITVIAAGVAALRRRWKILALVYLPMLALVGVFLLISPIALYRYSIQVDWSVPLMMAQCLSSLGEEGQWLDGQPCYRARGGARGLLTTVDHADFRARPI